MTGFISNIHAIHWLWKKLRDDLSYSCLCTNSLCQDCIENLFAEIRRRCGRNDTPNAYQFAAAFKYAALSANVNISPGANCAKDDSLPLINEDDPVFEELLKPKFKYAHKPLDLTWERTFSKNELNALMYIISAAVRKLSHQKCKKRLCLEKDDIEENHPLYKFCRLKNASVYAGSRLYKLGLEIFIAFKQKFNRFLYQNRRNVKKRLKEYIVYERYDAYVCQRCFDIVVDKILNTLIQGFLKQLRRELKEKTTAKRVFKRNRKAIRMNLPA